MLGLYGWSWRGLPGLKGCGAPRIKIYNGSRKMKWTPTQLMGLRFPEVWQTICIWPSFSTFLLPAIIIISMTSDVHHCIKGWGSTPHPPSGLIDPPVWKKIGILWETHKTLKLRLDNFNLKCWWTTSKISFCFSKFCFIGQQFAGRWEGFSSMGLYTCSVLVVWGREHRLSCFMILYHFFDDTGGGREVYEHQLKTCLCYCPLIYLCLIKLGA